MDTSLLLCDLYLTSEFFSVHLPFFGELYIAQRSLPKEPSLAHPREPTVQRLPYHRNPRLFIYVFIKVRKLR